VTLIAVAQTSSGDDIAENLATAVTLIEEAAASGAEAVFLPECFSLMQTSRQQLRENAERSGDGPIQQAMAEAASLHQIIVFAGSLPINSDDPKRVYNCSMVFTPAGGCVADYCKIHLFDVSLESGEQYLESAYTMAGTKLVNIETAIGNVGLSVCYDLRFPELYRALVTRGANILLVPSAFSPTTGPAHWEPLLRARAIENFCYVVAAAQTGHHPSGRSTYGHSLVVDPWGRVIAEKPEGVGLLMAEIDLKEVDNARRQMPSLEHRRQLS